MARLQDYPDITPTSSDKFLVVQSSGQGLVNQTSKMNSANPTGTGYVSMNRTGTVGQNSVAVGTNCTASGSHSYAHGYQTKAGGNYSTAIGNGTEAKGSGSMAGGVGTIAGRKSQCALGEYNIEETGYEGTRGTYVEIIGNGTADNARSNARTLDWSGNETIAGTLTQSSDAKLKDIINEELPDVSAIKAVKFKWKENANRDESEHIGYLAQDVEKVLPYLVKEDAEGNKVLDYIAFLVAKVDSLEKRIAELEG